MHDITKILTAHYEDCLKEYGPTARAMEWRKPEDLWLRYEVMLRILEPHREPFTLLDVGCGVGLLLDYLVANHFPVKEYIGVDASAQIVDAAKKKHPQVKFICADICDPSAELPRCDYVVTNGMFNLRHTASVEEMNDFFETATKRMYELCTKGIAFNVMSSYVNYRVNDLYYRDPGDVISYCVRELSRFVRVYHDYPLYEFFVCVYRPQPMRQ